MPLRGGLYCELHEVALMCAVRKAQVYCKHTREAVLIGDFWVNFQQEAQGPGALLDRMENNDHIELDNIEIYMYLSLWDLLF